MKKLITNYTFDASEKTITFGDYSNIALESVLLVTNVTDGVIIYNFADSAKGGSVATNVLTLEYDTASMSDTDDLLIYYDDPTATQAVSGTVTANLSATDNTVLDSIETAVEAIQAGQLPDSHNVTVDNPTIAVTQSGTWDEVGINDSGNSITVDGSVAVTQATAGNLNMTEANSAAIKTAVELIDNAIAGAEVQVDVVSMPTTTVQATNLDIRDLSSASDSVTVTGTVTANLGATDNAVLDDIAANQTDASQKTQIVDGVGNVIGATSNALDVNIKSGSSAGAQYTEGETDTTITGTAIMFESNTGTSALSAVSNTTPLPVSDAGGALTVDGTVTVNAGTNLNTSALALETGGNLAAIKAKTDNIPALGQALAAASVPVVLPAAQITTLTPPAAITNYAQETGGNLASINSKMVSGTDIGDVTINNAGGAAAVNIQDGGNTITVDGTVSITTNSAVNTAQINGVTPLMGNGVTGTGSQRVTIASDNTPFAVKTDQTTHGTTDLVAADVTKIAGTATAVGNGTASAGCQRVTIASDNTAFPVNATLQTGSNSIGKLAANSGVDIGDVDVTSLPALAAGTNAIGKLLPPDMDVTAHSNYARKYYTSAGAATDGIVWSPAAGKRWHVTSLFFQVSADATVTFEDDKAGGDDPVLKGEFKAGSGLALTFDEKYPFASGEDAADLLVTTSAGNIYITVVGYEV